MSEKFTLFFKNCLSQWNITSFEVDDVEYNCAEQYMMAEKARLFEDKTAEDGIMSASHPRDQKAIGRLVKNFNKQKWDSVARDIVYRGNYAKFTQITEFQEKLLDSKGTTLVEASPFDGVWGIKLDAKHSSCQDRSKWRGLNWLGEVLTKVRDDILEGKETTENFNWS